MSPNIKSAVLGFPRIGPKREVKKAIESYWSGKLPSAELLNVAKEQRLLKYKLIKDNGVDIIPSNDFCLYDHILSHSFTFNVIPSQYTKVLNEAKGKKGWNETELELEIEFAMGRGKQDRPNGIDLEAGEMKKWFDSNYHYIVPELSPSTNFKLNNLKPVVEFKEAKEAGYVTRPVIVGPITYLLLGKPSPTEPVPEGFQPIDLLDKILPVYEELLGELKKVGVEEIQIDEPILVKDLDSSYGKKFEQVYSALSKSGISIVLATYYGRLSSNLKFIKPLPISILHVDLDKSRSPQNAEGELDEILKELKGTNIGISLGVVSGRNIWKNEFKESIRLGKKAVEALGPESSIQISTSSSLLHIPVNLENEPKLKPDVKDWFSFATQKCQEVSVISKALIDPNDPVLETPLKTNEISISARKSFVEKEAGKTGGVTERVKGIKEEDLKRKNPYEVRLKAQDERYKLPLFPTTTIGSFPQTKEIRDARAKLGKSQITTQEYDIFIQNEIKSVLKFQESIELDILVHGEPERNDMVQYFGENLSGFVFTENAWVQSYGSRYVRPPIIVSDVERERPITVQWSQYAQSQSSKPVKGMLTGPVTILNWSFPRADISRKVQSQQLALALRDEVLDLEKAGIFAIQVDEPAIREGLPLRREDWNEYLIWAVDSFRLSTAGVGDSTQTHSHFCYSDFNDIFEHIMRLDADVISIEASKSDLKLLDVFKQHKYPNSIGPGVYDIHSPRVPSQAEIQEKISEMLKGIDVNRLFINPDCGLKTRGWKETEESLKNLVEAAKWARKTYGN